jgi:hypothetical protein
MMLPEPFTAIPFTAGIVTNLTTDILKSYAEVFEDTLVGKIFKLVGIIEPNSYERLHDILWKTLSLYFTKYPERDLSGLDDFFLDPRISEQIVSYILERKAINWELAQEAFELFAHKNTINQLQAQALDSKQILDDFIDCYRQILKEQLSLPQAVILFEIIEQKENIVAEIRESEQRILQFVGELFRGKLSSQSLESAYQDGQQLLAISLSDKLNPV